MNPILAHTFSLSVVILLILMLVVVGYGLPLAGIYLARNGGRLSASITTLIPSIWLGASLGQLTDFAEEPITLKLVTFFLSTTVVPMVLCLVGWILIGRNFLNQRARPNN